MCKIGTLPNNSSKNLRVRYLLLFFAACEMSTPMLSGMLERSVFPPTKPQTRLTTSSSPLYLNNSFSESVFEHVYPCNEYKFQGFNHVTVQFASARKKVKVVYHQQLVTVGKCYFLESPTGFVHPIFEALSIFFYRWCGRHRGCVNESLHSSWSNAQLHNALHSSNCSLGCIFELYNIDL